MIRKLFKHTIYDLDKAFQEGYIPGWNYMTEYWWHRFAPGIHVGYIIQSG